MPQLPTLDKVAFAQECWDLFIQCLFYPQDIQQLGIATGVSLLVVGIGLAKIHGIGNAGSGSPLVGVFVAIFGVFALISMAAMSKLLVLPLISDPALRPAAFICLVAAGLLLMVVPFTRMLFRAGYWTSVGAWVISLLLAGIVLFGLCVIWGNKAKKTDKQPTLQEVQEYGKDALEAVDQQ